MSSLRERASGAGYEIQCESSNFHQQGSLELENGELGWYRSCGQLHGRFAAWKEGRLVLEGTYRNGKKHGEFLHYDTHGEVVARESYSDGVKEK